LLPSINTRASSTPYHVKVLWAVTMKQLVLVNPNIAFSINLSEGIKVQLKEQKANVRKLLRSISISVLKQATGNLYGGLPVEPRIGIDCVENTVARFRIQGDSSRIQ
jgi:hypothetical protein